MDKDLTKRLTTAARFIWVYLLLSLRTLVPGTLAVLGIVEILGPISHVLEFDLIPRLAISAVLLGSAVAMAVHERHQEKRIHSYRSTMAVFSLLTDLMSKPTSEKSELSQKLQFAVEALTAPSRYGKNTQRLAASLLITGGSNEECSEIASDSDLTAEKSNIVAATETVLKELRRFREAVLYLPSVSQPIALVDHSSSNKVYRTLFLGSPVPAINIADQRVKSLAWLTIPLSDDFEENKMVILLLMSVRENGIHEMLMNNSRVWLGLCKTTIQQREKTEPSQEKNNIEADMFSVRVAARDAALKEASETCDQIAETIKKTHRGRKRGSVSRIGIQLSTVATDCGNSISSLKTEK